MRSIFVHFPSSQESFVRVWLDRNAVRVDDNNWHVSVADEPVLFCGIGELLDDWETGEIAAVRSALSEPSRFVQVDISGKVPGVANVIETVGGLLEAIPGSVATDDYTSHTWRLVEIREGVLVQGHPFFDFKGWYDEEIG